MQITLSGDDRIHANAPRTYIGPMGLFDKMKEAAGELVEGAKDKVTDVTGYDADKLIEAGEGVVGAADQIDGAATALQDGRLDKG